MLLKCFRNRSLTPKAFRGRRAFTLIEVMIGAVLLSTLVVSGLHGLKLHQRQLRFNENRIEATVLSERLLNLWSYQPDGVPIGAAGVLDEERQWLWRTELVGLRTVFDQPITIVRFEVIESQPVPGTVLVSVELLKQLPTLPPASAGPDTMSPQPEPETVPPPT